MANAPPDVLCSVFELLPFAERVNATHVCKYWRATSLSFPGTLWSRIVSNGYREGVLQQLLDRSQGAPVDLEVLLWQDTFEDVISAVSQHLFHICRLHLYSRPVGEGEPEMRYIPRIYRALAVPAPILEEVDIGLRVDDTDPDEYDSDDSVQMMLLEDVIDFDYRIPTNLFAGHAPFLRKASWLGMVLHPDGIPALSGVTRFCFQGNALSAAQLAAIVNTLPSLKSLRINAHYGYELPSEDPPAHLKLEELYLDVRSFASEQSIVPLLHYLGYQQIRLLTTPQFPQWLDLCVYPPRGTPHALRIYDDAIGYNDWRIESSTGYVSQGNFLLSESLLTTPLAHDVFASLETLAIHIFTLAVIQGFPPLPRLTRLFLCCPGMAALLDRIRHTPLTPRLACPNLHVLAIRDPFESGDRPTLSAENVELLMASLFVSDARPRVPHRDVEAPFSESEVSLSQSDTLTITNELSDMPMPWDEGDWNIWLSD